MRASEPAYVTERTAFVTQEPLPEVEINGVDLKVLRGYLFFQGLRHHSGMFVQPLAFPDSSFLYSLTRITRLPGLYLYIVILDLVDWSARVYSKENGEPTFRLATFTASNVVFGRPVVGVASVGQLIPDGPSDVASNKDCGLPSEITIA